MSYQTRSVNYTVSGSWTSPDSAFSDDGSCTDTKTDGAQNTYNFQNNPFSLPEGASITGLEVVVQRGGDGDDWHEIELYDSSSTWRLKTGTAYSGNCSTASDETLGSSSDDWGGSWTRTHINSSSFQARLTYRKSAKANNLYVDHVQVTVHYSMGPSPGWNDLEFASEPPVSGAWNKVKYDSEPPASNSWNKLKYKV